MTSTELSAWRTARAWSVRDLAARLGVEPSTVSRWESGKRPVPAWLPLALEGLAARMKRRRRPYHR
jgi:transcriptional regulator with XRE-family HTH domain